MEEERKELVEMICQMTEEQFAEFTRRVLLLLSDKELEFYHQTTHIQGQAFRLSPEKSLGHPSQGENLLIL